MTSASYITRSNYWTHPGVSQSQLRDLARSPMHYHAKHVARTATTEETAAMRFGSAFHAAVLEPESFAFEYVVATWDARTKAGKEDRDAALASGAKILSADDMETISAMAAALRSDPLASRILDARTHTEHPIAWECPVTGVLCKGKPDACVSIGGSVSLVDLKTTTDADAESFARSIANFGYHVQAAHYCAGWSASVGTVDSFTFIAIEKTAPYAIGVYELSADAMARGQTRRLALLDKLAECRSSNRWPGYQPTTIDLPRWAA